MRQFKITPNITNRESQSLDKYLEEVRGQELIDALKEVELAKKIKQGDQKALDTLVKANLRFVVSVAKQYQNQGLPLPDLINEGNLGLIKAAEKFDETRGFKFISYAVRWIRQSILKALAEQKDIVRKPLNVQENRKKVRKFQENFLQIHHRKPNEYEIAHALDIHVDEVSDILSKSQKTISLNQEVGINDTTTLEDLLENEDFPDPDSDLTKASLAIDIQRLLAYMNGKHTFEREKQILEMYFGLNQQREHTLEEIGETFDLTRERVRQLKEKAIRRLKHIAKSNGLNKYL